MDIAKENPSPEEKKPIATVDQFDGSYKKPIVATIVGSIIIVAGLLDYGVDYQKMSERNILLYWWGWILVRVAAAAWCVYLAKQQNRNQIGWGLFGLVGPGIALIFIGLQEKRRNDLHFDHLFDFEERHRYKNAVTKQTSDGQVLTIYTSLPVGYTVGDIVSIGDQPAPTGKYKLGFNHYLTVENGRILKL